MPWRAGADHQGDGNAGTALRAHVRTAHAWPKTFSSAQRACRRALRERFCALMAIRCGSRLAATRGKGPTTARVHCERSHAGVVRGSSANATLTALVQYRRVSESARVAVQSVLNWPKSGPMSSQCTTPMWRSRKAFIASSHCLALVLGVRGLYGMIAPPLGPPLRPAFIR